MGLDEIVLCFKKTDLPKVFYEEEFYYECSNVDFFMNYVNCNYEWLMRKCCETDDDYFQIIPYAVVQDNATGKILTYKRKGTENRLHGLLSCGIGGHVSIADYDDIDDDACENALLQCVDISLKREVREECGLEGDMNYSYQGIIGENVSIVGRVHLGFVYLISTEKDFVAPTDEISEYEWITMDDIIADIDNFELWSKLAVKTILKNNNN